VKVHLEREGVIAVRMFGITEKTEGIAGRMSGIAGKMFVIEEKMSAIDVMIKSKVMRCTIYRGNVRILLNLEQVKRKFRRLPVRFED